MVDVDKAIVAKLKLKGINFEILVDCDRALELKKGKSVGIDDVTATDDIFSDVKKGDRASATELQKFFGTTDVKKISEIIVRQGEVQLTAKHRAQEREEKRKRIVNLIHRNAIDSKTGLPHPIVRIENAMDEARVNIDEFKSAENQLNDVVEKLRSILSLKFEVKKFQIRIPANFAGKCYGVVKRYSKLVSEDWGGDGSLVVVVEISPGMIEEFFGQLNSVTHGDLESSEVK